jgi:hypothetical protein
MSRRSVVVLVLAAVVLAGARTAARQTPAPTVDDVIAKNLQAKGGLEKVRSIQSIKQTSQMSAAGGVQGTLTEYRKRPNFTRQEVTLGAFGTSVTAFDGQTAWAINAMRGQAPMVLSGPEAAMVTEQADFDGPLMDYKAKGFTADYVGAETLAGRRVHHLRLTGKDQRVQHWYLDAETGLESRVVSEAQSPAGKVELEQLLTDFRDVEGFKAPFLVRTLMNGVEQVKVQVEKVELNARFDDAVFKMPRVQ